MLQSELNIYRKISFTWDSSKELLCIAKEANLVTQTDAKGEFVFDLPDRGNGIGFVIVDEHLRRFGYLRLHRKEQKKVHTVTMSEPAYVEVLLECEGTSLANLNIDIGLSEPNSGSVLPIITAAYDFNEPVDLFSIKIPYPSGCHLNFYPEFPHAKINSKFKKDIPKLSSTEVFHLGNIRLGPLHHPLIGKEEPSLKVAEWVKGEDTLLESLKGKTVLLDFWGLWCPPCLRMFTKLKILHERYSHDGLRIIAIHDSSLDKKSFLYQGQKVFNLSDVPFRIALDSPIEEVSSTDMVGSVREGRTIETYGVTRFPTFVLIKKDGKIDWIGGEKVEERINLLLYGHTKILKKSEKLRSAVKKEVILIITLIGGLALVGFYSLLRRRADKRDKQ